MSAVRDPGLQAQRTALAWHRTGLAVLANALVILRGGVVAGHSMLTLLGGVLLVAATAVAAFGVWRSRALAAGEVSAVTTPAGVMLAASVVTVCAAAAGVLAVAHG